MRRRSARKSSATSNRRQVHFPRGEPGRQRRCRGRQGQLDAEELGCTPRMRKGAGAALRHARKSAARGGGGIRGARAGPRRAAEPRASPRKRASPPRIELASKLDGKCGDREETREVTAERSSWQARLTELEHEVQLLIQQLEAKRAEAAPRRQVSRCDGVIQGVRAVWKVDRRLQQKQEALHASAMRAARRGEFEQPTAPRHRAARRPTEPARRLDCAGQGGCGDGRRTHRSHRACRRWRRA